eukprot:371253_1
MSQQLSQSTPDGYWKKDLTINVNVVTNNVTSESTEVASAKMSNSFLFPFLMGHKTSPKSSNDFGLNTKYQQWNSKQDHIIQCPNPTANPIVNHRKQEEMVAKQKQQICDANYGKRMEQKVMEQNEIIQNLMHQNSVLSMQSAQQQNYIKMIQKQNSTLLSAYNALQKQSKTPNAKQFASWSVSDVIAWISSLDSGKFMKYSYSFCLNNIDGKGITRVTLDDLETMGIKDNIDKALLLSHIKQLGHSNHDTSCTRGLGGEGQINQIPYSRP